MNRPIENTLMEAVELTPVERRRVKALIRRLDKIYIELEELIGTRNTDELEVYIQDLETLAEVEVRR